MKARPRREAGFSFIEILIVMGIIAVLTGLVVVAIQIFSRKKPVIETESRVQKLTGALQHIHTAWGGQYPPTSIPAFDAIAGTLQQVKKVPNQSNLGIEALYQAIYWPGNAFDPQLSDAELSNTDDDEMEKAVGRGKTLDEVKDGFGNPIVYFPFTEYASAYEKPHTYILGDGSPVEVKPWKTERGFENPTSYQVFSFGEDGVPNTEDDIKGW